MHDFQGVILEERWLRTYVLETINRYARLGSWTTYMFLASPSTYGDTVLQLQSSTF